MKYIFILMILLNVSCKSDFKEKVQESGKKSNIMLLFGDTGKYWIEKNNHKNILYFTKTNFLIRLEKDGSCVKLFNNGDISGGDVISLTIKNQRVFDSFSDYIMFDIEVLKITNSSLIFFDNKYGQQYEFEVLNDVEYCDKSFNPVELINNRHDSTTLDSGVFIE